MAKGTSKAASSAGAAKNMGTSEPSGAPARAKSAQPSDASTKAKPSSARGSKKAVTPGSLIADAVKAAGEVVQMVVEGAVKGALGAAEDIGTKAEKPVKAVKRAAAGKAPKAEGEDKGAAARSASGKASAQEGSTRSTRGGASAQEGSTRSTKGGASADGAGRSAAAPKASRSTGGVSAPASKAEPARAASAKSDADKAAGTSTRKVSARTGAASAKI